MKYVFIFNPDAGKGKYFYIIKKIKNAFSDRGRQDDFIEEHISSDRRSSLIAKKYAEEYGEDCAIVACGGDGTIHEVVNGLVGTNTPLIVLPFGTGNDFAKKIYGEKNNPEIIARDFGFFDADPVIERRRIDTVKADGSYFVNVMSFGFDTKVVRVGKKIATKIKFLGGALYKFALVVCLFGNKKFHMKFTLNTVDNDGKSGFVVKELDYTLLALCNASFYGGGFCPSPESKFDDGVAEIIYAKPVNFFQILNLAPKYAKGTLGEHKKIRRYKVVSGVIESSSDDVLFGNFDGEEFQTKKIEFEMNPSSLTLGLIPKR